MLDAKELIVKRVAREFKEGDIVNLGIGLPTMVANYISESAVIIFQSKNLFMDMEWVKKENSLVIMSGDEFFKKDKLSEIQRSKHIDVTVVEALQVDEKGNLANDLEEEERKINTISPIVSKVITVMTHTDQGKAKIVKECTLPVSADKKVDLIITDLAVIEVTEEGLVLKEIAQGVTIEDILMGTEADLIISDTLKVINI